MTDLAAIKDGIMALVEHPDCLCNGASNRSPTVSRAEVLALLADTPSVEPSEDRRLVDTTPRIGALVEAIEFEIDMHNPVGPSHECDCGDQIKGETFNRHVAGMVDYRLTATDGDA